MMARHAILSTCGVCMLFLPISISECEKAAYSIHYDGNGKKTRKNPKKDRSHFLYGLLHLESQRIQRHAYNCGLRRGEYEWDGMSK